MLRRPGPNVHRPFRTTSAAVVVGAVVLSLAACGGEEEVAPGGGGGATAGGEPVDMGETLLEDSEARAELEAAAREEGSVIIYGSQEEIIYDDLLAAWEERYPDIDVELVYYSGADEWERVLAEISAGVAEIDGITPTVQHPQDAMEIGAFDETVDWASYGVPEEYIWEDGISVVWGHQVGGIAYSTERVSEDEAPQSWEDCADPKWSGEFVVDTRPSFPFALVDAYGEEELIELMKSWKANNPVFRRGQTATVETLAAGEYAFLCGAGYDAFRKVEAQGGAVGWVWPDPVAAFPRRGFVMADAESPSAATLWYLFMFSDDAQQIVDGIGNALVTGDAFRGAEDVEGKTISIAGEDILPREGEINDRIVSEAWQIVAE